MSTRNGLVSAIFGIILGLVVMIAWYSNDLHRVQLLRPDLDVVQFYDNVGDKHLFSAFVEVGTGNYPDFQKQLFELNGLTITPVFPSPEVFSSLPPFNDNIEPVTAKYLPDGSLAYIVGWWSVSGDGYPSATVHAVLFWVRQDATVIEIGSSINHPNIGWDGQAPIFE